MVKDKLFLLSKTEVEKYLPDMESRICLYEGKPRWWWLRSPGDSTHWTADVDYDGDLNRGGSYVSDSKNMVRPALHLNPSYLQFFERTEDGCVQFGAIKWLVLNEDSALLLSKDAVCECHFDKKCNDYKHSKIRDYLNKELIENIFSAKEKKMVDYTVIDEEVSYPYWLLNDVNQNTFMLMGGRKIVVPDNVDASSPDFFHDLEIKLWNLLKDYMYKMNIVVEEPDVPDIVSVRAIQAEILNLIESHITGVDFKWY